MKSTSIRTHLVAYSILNKRRTTITHAFASAIAPSEEFSSSRVEQALDFLGQSENNLTCVYCGQPAQTWDHMVGIVKQKRSSGYGHTLGNLVPCCRECNSKKGNKDWRVFVNESVNADRRTQVIELLSAYQSAYKGHRMDYERLKLAAEDDLVTYEQLEQDILKLMAEADIIAIRLRTQVANLSTQTECLSE